MFYRGGRLVESSNWVVPVYGQPESEALSEFIGQYYGEGRLVPREILLPADPDDRALIEEWLADLRGGAVDLVIPRRGERRQALELAETNARTILERKLSGRVEIEAMLDDLARRLRLATPPRLIECYDIATLQGEMSAGSKVALLDGEPHKAGYRLYKIRTVEGQDDFAMMREVLTRRFSRAQREEETLPDLVVVDGGKASSPPRRRRWPTRGFRQSRWPRWPEPTHGPKDSRVHPVHSVHPRRRASAAHRQEPHPRTPLRSNRKNPVNFPPYAPSFYLLQRLRDEAHRFVNTYHAKLRRKARIGSTLEKVPGIGPRRARALLRHFGSLARVRAASLDDLAAAPGMSSLAAQGVFRALHPPSPGAPVRHEQEGSLAESQRPPRKPIARRG